MNIKLIFSAAALLFSAFVAHADIISTTPPILQESSTGVVLTYDAASPQGNKGLVGISSSALVYAHIGVITTKSDGQWSHVLTPWPESNGSNANSANTLKNRLTRVADNTYTLNIGNIRTYFGITDPDEHVTQIAVVFRNADGTREGKTALGGDILVPVYPEGFVLTFSSDAASQTLSETQAVNFTACTTHPADLVIELNGKSLASAEAATSLSKSYAIAAPGDYIFEAKATYQGQTYSQQIELTRLASSSAATYPGGTPVQGAVRNSDGSVTFCLAAPGKKSVVLVPSWDDYQVLNSNMMRYHDYLGNRYFWITVSGLDDATYYPYYYLVDGTIAVGDPYARLVLDGYNDRWLDPDIWPDMPKYPYDRFDDIQLAVYRSDIDSYDWQVRDFCIPDHSQLVVYELLLRDFTGTVGAANANGTVRQAIDKIPYLVDLGVNAVELMPIMEFNGNISWGYNTNFYFAPDKAYGSPDDYREFIDLCHANGIAVILDIVFNQSDGLHPWYQMYDIDSNPFYNKVAPHAYSVLNDWNQGGNPLVEQQWADAIRYWMTAYNVDGFRFDLVKGLGDNNSYSKGTDDKNDSRIARMKRLHAVIKSVKPDGIHINEDLAHADEEIELGLDGMIQWANINISSGRFAAGWNSGESGLPGGLVGGNAMSAFLSTAQESRPWGSTVSYAESHDEQRIAYYVDNNARNATVRSARYRRLGCLAVEMLLTPGPKMIWQFGELGDAQNTKDAYGNNTDPKVVSWFLLDEPDAVDLHDTYRTLCHFRADNPELFAQDAEFEVSSFNSSLTMPRRMRLRAGDKEVIAMINPAPSTAATSVSATVSIGQATDYQLLYATPGTTVTPTASGQTLSARIAGGNFAIFASPAALSGIDDIIADPNASLSSPTTYYNLQGIPVASPLPGHLYLTPGHKILFNK